MNSRYFWRAHMDYYEFLRVNNFAREDDPVKIFNEITLEYINRRENA